MRTLEEVDAVSAKDRVLLGELKKIIRGSLPTAEILLYGSVARGTQDAGSDYDILILSDEKLTRAEEDEIDTALYAFGLARDAVISPVFHSNHTWHNTFLSITPFHDEVEREAVIL